MIMVANRRVCVGYRCVVALNTCAAPHRPIDSALGQSRFMNKWTQISWVCNSSDPIHTAYPPTN